MRRILKSLIVFAVMAASFSAQVVAQDLLEARKLTSKEQYEQASDLYKKLIATTPTADAYYYAGENAWLAYFADTISNTIGEAAKEAGDFYKNGVKVDSMNPLNYVGLAKTLYYIGKDNEASQYRTKAKSLLPPYKKIKKIANPTRYAYTLIKLAETGMRNNKVDTSIVMPYMRESFMIDIKNAESYIIAGDIYLVMGNGSKSISNYNLAQDLEPQSTVASMKIGSIYMKARNLQVAIPYFEKAIEIDSTFAPAYRELGQLYSLAGKYDQSKQYYKTYLDLTQGNIPAKIRYVNSLYFANDYAEVISNVEEIFAIDQSRTYLNRIAAYSCYEKKPADFEKGKAYMQTLMANLDESRILRKDYIYYGRILLKKNADYSKLATDTARMIKDVDNFQNAFNKAKADAKPALKVKLDSLSNALNARRALLANANSEIDLGIKQYQKALSIQLEDVETLTEFGNSCYSVKRFNDAAWAFKTLISLGRNTLDYNMLVGKTYYQAKDFTRADSTFTSVIEKFPNEIVGYVWLANSAAGADPENETGLSLQRYQSVIDFGRKDTVKYANEIFEAYRFFGSFYLFDRKDYNKAKEYFTLMLNLAPDNKDYKVKAYTSLATLYTTMGASERESEPKIAQYQRAIEQYQKILELEPANAAAKANINTLNTAISNIRKGINPDLIKGIVTDKSGKPIGGASVRVKDTAAETITGADGKYAFEIPKSSEALLVTAPGRKPKEVPVSASVRVYNIILD